MLLPMNKDTKPTLINKKHCNLNRKEEVIIHRMHIGHTKLTHQYLLTGKEQPRCSHCQHLLSVKHILMDCKHLEQSRIKYFKLNSLKELFESTHPKKILEYLKDINLYSKIHRPVIIDC